MVMNLQSNKGIASVISNAIVDNALSHGHIVASDSTRIEMTKPIEGKKFDQDKPDMALIPSKVLVEIAKVLTMGKNKYGALNWTKGINYTRLISAAYRHLTSFQQGEDVDKESNLNHLAHAIVNLMFMLHFELTERKELDDRWEKE